MHNAPAVSYPVGCSRFQGLLLLAISLLGMVSSAIWFAQVDSNDWREWLMLSGAILTAFGAWWQWRHAVAGQLAWDGVTWIWTETQASASVQVAVIADAQRAMLLLLSGAQDNSRRWIWVDRETSPMRWLALRRAIHQRHRLDADPLADAPQQGAARP
jgi:hypothetical protein